MSMQRQRREAEKGNKRFHGYPRMGNPCQALFTAVREICQDCVKDRDSAKQRLN